MLGQAEEPSSGPRNQAEEDGFALHRQIFVQPVFELDARNPHCCDQICAGQHFRGRWLILPGAYLFLPPDLLSCYYGAEISKSGFGSRGAL